MGLIKKIELDNGIATNYHRIVSINNITNVSTVIEVASYTSKDKREKEKEAIKNGESMDIFIDTRLINKDYSENYDITKGYKFLKTLEEFKDAEDDLEEK